MIEGKAGIRTREKSLKKFKDKVREVTRRNRGRSVSSIARELIPIINQDATKHFSIFSSI
jgi:hypothetical protein